MENGMVENRTNQTGVGNTGATLGDWLQYIGTACKYGDATKAAQNYLNDSSYTNREALFQALYSNDNTKAGAKAMFGNQSRGADLVNSAMSATGDSGLSNLSNLMNKLGYISANNSANNNVANNVAGGGTTQTTNTSTASFVPGLLDSSGVRAGGALSLLRR